MSVSNPAYRHYRIFGLTLASDFDFKTPLLAAVDGKRKSDILFTCSSRTPDDLKTQDNQKIFDSSATRLKIYKNKNWQTFEYPEYTTFFLNHDRIHCQLKTDHVDHLVEIRLFGFVISYWLTLYKHNAMLHGSAVTTNSESIIFIATNSGGKTSLASAMLKHCHYALLSDDIVRISNHGGQLKCYPSYPQIRLWPDQVAQFLDEHPDNFTQVHPQFNKRRINLPNTKLGEFNTASSFPSVIYQPVRSTTDPKITFTPLSAKQVFILLRRNLFIRDLLTSKDLQTKSFELLAHIANTIPAYELVYPQGFEHLPLVCNKINQHVMALPPNQIKIQSRQ